MNTHKHIIVGLAVSMTGIVFFLGIIAAGKQEPRTFPIVTVRDVPFRVEIADSTDERAQGLQGRTSLPIGEGMLFIFPEKTVPDFWMKNTVIPLDILWIADEQIVDMTLRVQPEPLMADDERQRYHPRVPVDQVLELNGGVATSLNFAIGDSVRLDF